MSDIATIWKGSSSDWLVDGADLASGQDLETAVFISVMSDRALPAGTLPPDGSRDPRGWWGDDPAYPVGSRIWTLERAIAPAQATLDDAYDFLVECLQWLIDDGVVKAWDITTEWDAPGFLAAMAVASMPDGTTQQFNFSWAWATLNH